MDSFINDSVFIPYHAFPMIGHTETRVRGSRTGILTTTFGIINGCVIVHSFTIIHWLDQTKVLDDVYRNYGLLRIMPPYPTYIEVVPGNMHDIDAAHSERTDQRSL